RGCRRLSPRARRPGAAPGRRGWQRRRAWGRCSCAGSSGRVADPLGEGAMRGVAVVDAALRRALRSRAARLGPWRSAARPESGTTPAMNPTLSAREAPYLAPLAPKAPIKLALGTMNFGKRTSEGEAERI